MTDQSQYTSTKADASNRLFWVRSIHQLRKYVYSLSRDERHYFFTHVGTYLQAEQGLLTNEPHKTDKDAKELQKLAGLIGKWNIQNVEALSTHQWWSELLYNSYGCKTLKYIRDTYTSASVENDDGSISDNSTLGIR